MPTEEQQVKDTEISLKEIILKFVSVLKYLRSKWKVIFMTGILGGLLGLGYAYIKKPIYTATLDFALEDDRQGGSLSGALGLASQFGFDLGSSSNSAFFGDNLLELMKSRSMVETTLLTPVDVHGKSQTLAELYIAFNKFHEKWKNKPALSSISFLPNADQSKFTLQQDSILGVFCKTIVKDNLYVDKLDKKLSIIKVNVSSKNELFSKFFAEILVKTVSDFYINTKTKKSVENVRILQHQTDSVRRQLNAAITGAASMIDVNPNPNPSLQILRTPSQHRQVDVQTNQAILTELVKNLEISKVSLRKETPLIQMIDAPVLPLEKEEVSLVKGMFIGGIISVFLITFSLLITKMIKDILN